MEKRTPIQKSIVRHKLKEIDKKWHGRTVPAPQKALDKSKEHPVIHALKTYGDKGKEHIGSFEDRLKKFGEFKKKL